MTRPRTPFGTDRPGRVAATMIRVLAAEMSDPGRLTRGKRLWSQQAVLDIMVDQCTVTTEVQGSRPLPYVVTIETEPGHRTPSRDQVSVWCTCPDDDGSGHWACKHVVASLFALSDEIAIDLDVLSRWRGSERILDVVRSDHQRDARTDDVDDDDDDDADADADADADGGVDAHLDLQARVIRSLVSPDGGPRLPPLPTLAPAQHPSMPDPLVTDVLESALSHLEIRWE